MIPTNKKAPGACNPKGLDTDTTNDLNIATGERNSKAVANFIAQLAIREQSVQQLTGRLSAGAFGCWHDEITLKWCSKVLPIRPQCHLFDQTASGTGTKHDRVTPRSDWAADAAVAKGKGLPLTDLPWPCVEHSVEGSKRFATLRARLALEGYSLSRTDASDGPVRFFIGRWGLIREQRDLASVTHFLSQIGGAA